MESTYTAYFICITKEGEILNFKEKCNAVDYSNPNVAIFMCVEPNVDGTRSQGTLAMIPWSEVQVIISSDSGISIS